MRERKVRDRAKHRRRVLSSLLTRTEERLSNDAGKPTVVDYIRLTQMEREMEGTEQLQEVRVSWTKPTEGSGTGG